MSDHAVILEEHPGEDVPDMLPCPQCRVFTPFIIVARRTSVIHGIYHYHLCGCEHSDGVGEWNFPPRGMSTSRRALAEAWNQHVGEMKP